MKMHFKEIKYLNSFSQLKQDHVFLYYIYTITRFSKIIYNICLLPSLAAVCNGVPRLVTRLRLIDCYYKSNSI